jgi:hypothetical protein
MEPVRQDRKETGDEMVFRATDGTQGQAPMERASRERRYVARALAGQQAAGSTQTRIPKGAGAPLPSTVRSKMEPKLGARLGDVRIHNDGESAQAAKGFGARAFTVGQDVHFNAGEFNPGTKEGDKLIAHELTHVVQGQKSGIQRKEDDGAGSAEAGADAKGVEVSDPNDEAEKEADETAEKVTADDKEGGDEKASGDEKKDKRNAKGEGKEGGDDKGGSGDKGADVEGGDAKESGGDTKQEPAPVSAKLEGVGFKVFRAEDPSNPNTPAADGVDVDGLAKQAETELQTKIGETVDAPGDIDAAIASA